MDVGNKFYSILILYVAGGPVGPDGTLQVLEPLEHSVLDHAEPAGQHAVIQEVLEPLEHSVLDHADPAGQHAVIQEVLEPLEHSVLDTALDGQPREGIPVLEPLEHSVLEMTLDGGPFEEMVDWEPLTHMGQWEDNLQLHWPTTIPQYVMNML